jgi:hypothetical protein
VSGSGADPAAWVGTGLSELLDPGCKKSLAGRKVAGRDGLNNKYSHTPGGNTRFPARSGNANLCKMVSLFGLINIGADV